MTRHRNATGGLLALSVLLWASAPPLTAQVADPDPQRFAEDFAEFASWDAKNSVPRDAILFVGSSSIVRWDTAKAFPGLPIINRGFGGSQASDATHWVSEAVLKYDPAVVVYYEGDNDTGAGKKAPQILADVREFAEAVLADDPDTQVVLLSIKPSLLRWNVWSEAVAANELIKSYAQGNPSLHYVDVGTPMLGPDGQPVPAHFVSDGLHMTQAGYDVWNRVVGPVLASLHH
jgi:lysophospholipase L1-like esterase